MKRSKLIFIAMILSALFQGCDSEEFASAKTWVKSNNLEKAEEFFVKAMAVEPENAEVPLLLASDVYLPQRRWAEMNEALDEALRRNPQQVTVTGSTIAQAVETVREVTWGEEYQKGAVLYNEVLAETNQEAPNEAQQDKLRQVAKHFHTAIEIYPGKSSTYEPLVFTYRQLRDEEGELAAIETALKNNPDNGLVHALAGQNARKAGRLAKAVTHMQRASELMPDDLDILTILTGIYLDMDNSEAAIETLERARATAPRNAEVFFNMGAIYINVANAELTKGQKIYVAAAGADMPSKAIMAKEALAHFEKAQTGYSEGLYFMDNVLALDPDDDDANQAIKDIRDRKKRLGTLQRAAQGLIE